MTCPACRRWQWSHRCSHDQGSASASAHELLDAATAGAQVPRHAIDLALIATGDLEPHHAPTRFHAAPQHEKVTND